MAQRQYAAAWYPDPYAPKGSGTVRWYDGAQWTGNVRKADTAAATPSTAGALLKMAFSGSSAVVPTSATPGGRRRPPTSALRPQASAGTTWESIPQPGTTFAGGTAPRLESGGRRVLATVMVVLVALAGAVVLLALVNRA